jgi:AhpD family alkylhydroperoxidase
MEVACKNLPHDATGAGVAVTASRIPIHARKHPMSTFDHSGLIKNINQHLAPLRKSQPEAMQAFGQLARSAMAEGAVSAKHKELMALAIGITQHCSGCIGFHVKALIKLGCTRQELEEMLSVCVYMGGGPALMYTAEALSAFELMSADAGTV